MAVLDPGPSPSRNPFARPNGVPQGGSFSKSTILPSPSQKRPMLTAIVNDVDKSLGDSVMATPSDKKVISTNGTPKSSWRLLWRGGLELGKEGWRLEGTRKLGGPNSALTVIQESLSSRSYPFRHQHQQRPLLTHSLSLPRLLLSLLCLLLHSILYQEERSISVFHSNP